MLHVWEPQSLLSTSVQGLDRRGPAQLATSPPFWSTSWIFMEPHMPKLGAPHFRCSHTEHWTSTQCGKQIKQILGLLLSSGTHERPDFGCHVTALHSTLIIHRVYIWGITVYIDRGWVGWMASLTSWTWVWVNSGSWWWTGRPGVLKFVGSQRAGHDWATELNWYF